jgi:hypothetical protein
MKMFREGVQLMNEDEIDLETFCKVMKLYGFDKPRAKRHPPLKSPKAQRARRWEATAAEDEGTSGGEGVSGTSDDGGLD